MQSAKQAVGRPKKALDRSGTNVDNEEQEAKKQKMKKAEKQKAAELIDEAQRSEAMPVLMELMGRLRPPTRMTTILRMESKHCLQRAQGHSQVLLVQRQN